MYKIIEVEASVTVRGHDSNEPAGCGDGSAVVMIDKEEYTLPFEIMHAQSFVGGRLKEPSFMLIMHERNENIGVSGSSLEFSRLYQNHPIFFEEEFGGGFFEELEDELRGYAEVENVFSALVNDFQEGRGEEVEDEIEYEVKDDDDDDDEIYYEKACRG